MLLVILMLIGSYKNKEAEIFLLKIFKWGKI